MQTSCGGGGGGRTQSPLLVPPSGYTATAQPALATPVFGSGAHDQFEGQSAAVVHETTFAWQCEVARTVHPQSEVDVLVPEGAGAGADGSRVPLLPAVPLLDPLEPLPLTATATPASATPVPPLPEHQHSWSGTHENPSPHEASDVQGSTYLGTHADLVVVVQVGVEVEPPVPQGMLGAHVGATSPVQVCSCQLVHTMPSAQSVSAVHGSGWHSLYSVGVHVGHVCPGAQAMSGQGVNPAEMQL